MTIFKEFIKFSFGSWIASIISFITVPITTMLIVPAEFGRSTLFVLWANVIFQVILLGGDSGFMRFFYKISKSKWPTLLWSSLFPSIGCWFIVSLALLGMKDYVSNMLIGYSENLIVYLLISQLFIMLFERYSFLIVRMQQKGICFSMVRVVSALFTPLTLILYAKYVNANFYAVIYSTIVSLLVSFSILVVLEKKIWFSITLPNINIMKRVFVFGFPLLFTGFIAMFFEGMDKIMLRQFSTFSELGIYNVAFKIVTVLAIIQSSFSTFWTPLSYKTYEENKFEKTLFEKTFKNIAFILILIAFLVIGFREILVLFLDEQYYSCIDVVPFLVFMPISYTLTEVTTIGINFMNKTRYYVYIFIALIFISVLFYVLFVPIWGAKGASLSLALSYISYFLIRTIVANKLFPFHLDIKVFVSLIILFIDAFINTFIPYQNLQIVVNCILLGGFLIYNISLTKYFFKYIFTHIKKQ